MLHFLTVKTLAVWLHTSVKMEFSRFDVKLTDGLELCVVRNFVLNQVSSESHWHWTKIEISYMFCSLKCDISSHFLHITSRGYMATFHANERNV